MNLQKIKDLLPLPSYSIILLTFLFPFVLFTCNDQTLMRVRGYELATGFDTEEKMGGLFDEYDDFGGSWYDDDYADESEASPAKKTSPNPFILIAMLAAITGLILVFVKTLKKRAHVNIAIGLAGFLSLLLFAVFIQSETEAYTSELMTIEIKFGTAFYIASGLFLIIVSFFAYYLYEEKQTMLAAASEAKMTVNEDDGTEGVAETIPENKKDENRFKPSA